MKVGLMPGTAVICFVTIFILVSTASDVLARTRVVDGDTLEIDGRKVRLHGIDAPEAGQFCKKAVGGLWPCGKKAIETLNALTSIGDVTCDDRGKDRYDRTIGVCEADGKIINAVMVLEGWAWAFRKYSMDYATIEDNARERRLGVWQAVTETPWDYRSRKWEIASQLAPAKCPIKGNISRQGNIYHAPWSPWYGKTHVNTAKGERWFCSEEQALEAGWRAPFWGN